MPRAFAIIMGLQFTNLFLIIGLWVSGNQSAAEWFGYFGPAIIIFGGIAYATIFDSRSRWPDLSPSQRLTRILTFQR